MRAFTSATPLPCLANMLSGGLTPRVTPARLHELGFAMAAYPLDLLGASAQAMEDALAQLATDEGPPAKSHAELLEIVQFREGGV